MASIAAQAGFPVQTIWDFPANSELKKIRKNPYTLVPGDVVTIPPTTERVQDCPTDKKYRFRLKTEPEYLRLVVLDGYTPFANQKYTLFVDEDTFEGQTDKDGALEQQISPLARGGRLFVGTGETLRSYYFRLGCLQPIDTIGGAQGRLYDLGYYDGEVTGKLDGHTRVAILRYQHDARLERTGEYDAATQDKLQKDFGC